MRCIANFEPPVVNVCVPPPPLNLSLEIRQEGGALFEYLVDTYQVPSMAPGGGDVAIYPTAVAASGAAEIDRYTWNLDCFGGTDIPGPNPLETLTAAGVSGANWTGPCTVTVTALDRCGSMASATTKFVLTP